MFHHIRSKQCLMLLGVLWVFPGLVAGAGGDAPLDGFEILTPNDPNSTAVIDGPWDDPMVLTVVTGDAVDTDLDPSAPARIALTIQHPQTGVWVNINIVEIAVETLTIETFRGTREFSQWRVNGELPFTQEAELQAAADGFAVRVSRLGAGASSDEPECWVTGAPVVEIPVFFNPERLAVPSYDLVIGESPLHGRGDGRWLRDRGIDLGDGKPEGGDGGDPGGNPDPPSHESGEGGEGGDPGGNPDPPALSDE